MKSSASPLRIAYLAQHFLPETGALPARVAEMAQHWTAAGAEVTVLAGMPHRPHGVIPPEYRRQLFQEEVWRGIRIIRSWLYASPHHGFSRTVLNNLSFMITGALSALIKGGAFDVLIASAPPFFVHFAGEALRRTRGVPLVLEVRDFWPDYLVDMGTLKPERLATRALFRLEANLLRNASRVITVTESFRARAIQKGARAESVEVVANGVDTDQYYASREAPPVPQLERRGDELIVGYLGNFGVCQQLGDVVEAAAKLQDDRGVRFVIAGDGPDRAKVAARIREIGGDNIALLPSIPKEETRSFYNACDVCLVPLAPFPVLEETVPSKLFEIMACERPILASLDGEAAAIVRQASAGVAVPAGNSAAIAAAVRQFRERGSKELATMGANGRRYVLEHFSRAALAERYLKILEQAAGRHVPARVEHEQRVTAESVVVEDAL